MIGQDVWFDERDEILGCDGLRKWDGESFLFSPIELKLENKIN